MHLIAKGDETVKITMRSLIAGLILTSLTAIGDQAQAATSSCPDINPYMEAGEKLISSSPGEAGKVYAEAVKLCPTSAGARYNLALSSLRQGDFRGAHGSIQKAFALAPDSMPVKSLYISVLIAGKLDKTMGKAMLDRETAASPKDPDIGKARVASLLTDARAVGKIFSPLMAMERSKKKPDTGRYSVDLGEGTVTDTKSGLMWEYSNNEYLSHTKAARYCRELRLGGHEDWALPGKKQMMSLVVEGRRPSRGKPMFDGNVFPKRPVKRYWLKEKKVMGVGDYNASSAGPPALTFNMERAKLGEYDTGSRKHVWCVREGGGAVAENNSRIKARVRGNARAVAKTNPQVKDRDRGRQLDNSRYSVSLSEGTVTDTQSGLMWEYSNNEYLNHTKAARYCQELRLGGYKDWALPSREQMKSLVVEGRRPARSKPMFNGDVFPDRPVKRYWLKEEPAAGVGDYTSSGRAPQGMTFNMERAKVGEYGSDTRKHVWCVRAAK
jgi:hypothetical protein